MTFTGRQPLRSDAPRAGLRRLASISLALLLFAVRAPAQELERVVTSAQTDLQAALVELSALRQQIEAERLPLARQLSDLEQKLSEQKSALARAQRFQENQLVELNALKAEAKRQADEVKYVDSLVNEYARAFRSRLSFIEEPRYQELFDADERASAAADLSPAERFNRRAQLLTAALKRAEAALGGERFAGKALDKQGRVQSGKVALLGPVAVFASDSGELAGLVQQELNKSDPTVLPINKDTDAASRSLATTGTGQLGLDATLGNASKLIALKESLYEKIAKGGPVMIPLLALGAAALLVALVKWLQFSRIRLVTEMDLQRVLRHLEQHENEQALALARGVPGPTGDLLATALEHADERKQFIEELVYEKMLGARTRLECGLAFLALAATAGPLMGLLGTVMGMIATFKLISSFGSGDPKLLAAGISEALIATATGMAVAIPALLLHAFLNRRAKSIIGSMEQTAVGFLNGIPEADAETEKSTYA